MINPLYSGKPQFIFSVPQLSIFDPELLFEKQKSTRQTGGLSQGYKPKLPASA
ncbi:hypothetical protein WKI17_02155 [Streptococcus pneumoniae]|uniref:hypothetical protein n=1 Tax=Streptococcus pseudopneumoniae TaxID=257758 RepID=UPI003123E730